MKQLSITLTEPVVFLRSSDPSGRHQPDPNDPLTLVRGILNLHVVKPIGISSIEVELSGVLTVIYSEGAGPRRIELPEKQIIYSSTVTLFRADQAPHGKRPASVGPGLLSAANLNNWRSERQSTVGVPQQDLGPTPPYTPVAQFPTPTQRSFGALEENSAQTVEGLRQALRDNLEGEAYPNVFTPPHSRSHSIALSPSNLATRSNASCTSNDSLPRESDDMVHTSSPFEDDAHPRNSAEEYPHVLPRRPSPEDTHGTQPRTRGHSYDPSSAPARPRLRLSFGSVLDAVMGVTNRVPSRSQGVVGSEEMERGRTRARAVAEQQFRPSILQVYEGVAGAANGGSQLGVNAPHPGGHMEHREHHFLGLGRVLGLERDHEEVNEGEQTSKEHQQGWREFKPGTYSYPIAFLLPPNLPPTFSVSHASLDYTIKGFAHRPGTFTSKLSCQVPLLVVTAPVTGGGENGVAGDIGPLFVEKQWEGRLAYSFGLSSRLFLLGSRRHLEAAASGGIRANPESLVEAQVETRAEAAYDTVMLDLTLLPFEKIKIWKLDVVIEQRTRYVDELGRPLRDDDKKRVGLLEVQDTRQAGETGPANEEEQAHKNKHNSATIPLLPTPMSPHRSPLLRYLPPSTDPSILAGPGPYMISTDIGLPGLDDPSSGDRGLYSTMKQRRSIVKVEHSLRVVLRVEKVGDEGAHDHEGDRKKFFDIAIQTPITILSCRCVPEYQTLPKYSRFTEDGLQTSVVGRDTASTSTSSHESEDGAERLGHHADEHGGRRNGRSRSPSRTRRNGHASPLSTPLHPHLPPPPPPPSQPSSSLPSSSTAGRAREAGRARSGSPSTSTSTTLARRRSHGQHCHAAPPPTFHIPASVRSQTSPVSTPGPSRPPSPLARYERLVSGLESEVGEAPPSYESISSSH